ncbi:hypothetical protein Tco_1109976 [Tanacetum coccineum]|uniref:Uncharacterized protein n=1 Tax=Tanacetum coccineum TaxID=301880 RepID=A0ABQ5IJX8_9ASTR
MLPCIQSNRIKLEIGFNAFQQDPSPHERIFYPIPCSILSTGKDAKSAMISDVCKIIGESYIEAYGSLQGLTPKKDLALYDNESCNDPRDFANPVKAIALPQDVPSTSDCRLIELKNQVQCLMEAYLASTQPTQVNKITASCEIYNGPYDTHNCTEGPEQACVDYASSHTNEIRDKRFISNQGPRNFNDAANTWKDNPNFNWERTQTFTKPTKNESISIHFNYQIKLEKALLDFDFNQEKSKDSDTEEDTSSTNAHEHELNDMERRSEGIKEHGKEDDEIETDMEVEEVIEEEESEFETDEEVKEVFEEDEDDESFNSFPTMKELIPVALSISTMEKWSSENPSKKKQALPTMKKKEWSCLARIESIPPSAHEENFGHRRTHYYQSFLIGDEYKQDRGDRRGIRHLIRLEKEMMDNKGEVT